VGKDRSRYGPRLVVLYREQGKARQWEGKVGS
jgi:hypothetical protein